jgi:hypothetical protein
MAAAGPCSASPGTACFGGAVPVLGHALPPRPLARPYAHCRAATGGHFHGRSRHPSPKPFNTYPPGMRRGNEESPPPKLHKSCPRSAGRVAARRGRFRHDTQQPRPVGGKTPQPVRCHHRRQACHCRSAPDMQRCIDSHRNCSPGILAALPPKRNATTIFSVLQRFSIICCHNTGHPMTPPSSIFTERVLKKPYRWRSATQSPAPTFPDGALNPTTSTSAIPSTTSPPPNSSSCRPSPKAKPQSVPSAHGASLPLHSPQYSLPCRNSLQGSEPPGAKSSTQLKMPQRQSPNSIYCASWEFPGAPTRHRRNRCSSRATPALSSHASRHGRSKPRRTSYSPSRKCCQMRGMLHGPSARSHGMPCAPARSIYQSRPGTSMRGCWAFQGSFPRNSAIQEVSAPLHLMSHGMPMLPS